MKDPHYLRQRCRRFMHTIGDEDAKKDRIEALTSLYTKYEFELDGAPLFVNPEATKKFKAMLKLIEKDQLGDPDDTPMYLIVNPQKPTENPRRPAVLLRLRTCKSGSILQRGILFDLCAPRARGTPRAENALTEAQ